MELRRLGRTGVPVSALALGTRSVGSLASSDPGEAARLVADALDAGITLVDTADADGRGAAERVVGDVIAGRRDEVFLSVRFGDPVDDDPAHRGNARNWVFHAVEASLRRLGTDHIDLYQPVRPDPSTALDETLEALSDLVAQGKIRYFGTAAFPEDELVEAQWTRSGGRAARTLHTPYSALTRTAERLAFPVARRFGLGVIAHAPLAGGWLSGVYGSEQPQPRTPRSVAAPAAYAVGDARNRAKLNAVDALARLADDAGITLIELAVGFALSHPDVTSVAVGPRTGMHLHAYLQSSVVVLPDDVLDEIDRIVSPGTHTLERDIGVALPGLAPERLRRPQARSAVRA